MVNEQYATLTELGVVFGVTRNAIGKRLKEIGLRTSGGKPSSRAFGEGFVSQRWVVDRPGIYLWAWDKQKTIAELERSGLRRAVPREPDDFSFRRVGTTGHEIINADGVVIAWTVDEGWAARIVGLLNG
jgi:hypothetical protein